jgi:hypothetical protein
MKLRFCVICGTNKNLHHHHVIPKVSGGTDHQHNLITLCDKHHEMVHRIRHVDNWFELARKGREKAMARGVRFGAKRKYDQNNINEIMDRRKQGEGYGTIAKAMGMSRSTVSTIVKRELNESISHRS